MNYDVRVIWLEKSTKDNSLTSFCAGDHDGWVCLGHFDMMRVELLRSCGTPLKAVWEHTQKPHHEGTNYCYPLYILHQFRDESEGEEEVFAQFWECPSIYTTVTRLHCDRGEVSDLDREPPSLIELLTEHCIKGRSERFKVQDYFRSGYINLTVCSDERQNVPVQVVFYESLELGDIVAVSKGDSISAILNFQRHIYECPAVSDIYTYCGISRKVFQSHDSFQLILDRHPLLNNTYLTYASTRCSVQNNKSAYEFLAAVVYDPKMYFFVTGTADIVIEWNNSDKGKISEKEFLNDIYRVILHADLIYEAFRDVITRIGLDYTNSSSPKWGSERYKISLTDELRKKLCAEEFAYPWGSQFLRLLDTMNTMLKDSVMDDLVKLLSSGICALIQRMEYLIVEQAGLNAGWQPDYDKQILSFMDEWTSFTNDIIHLEVQLVQHPELSPVRYFIPAMILHFEQQWVIECAKTIQEIDKNLEIPDSCATGYQFQPILIPTTINNASTICILDPWNDKAYSGQVPLRIRLPIKKLYQPWETAHILCHELAHYCGDAIRKRPERMECLMNCAVIFMLGVLHSQLRNGPVDTQNVRYYHAKALPRLKMLMAGHIDKTYLSQVERNLSNAIWDLASDPLFRDQYQDYLLRSLPADVQNENFLDIMNQNQMKEGILCESLCKDHIIHCLIDLCRECYADIVMILTLACSFENYYRCVFQEEFQSLLENWDERDDMWPVAENHINRMALVVLTVRDANVMGDDWYNTYTPEDFLGQESLRKVEEWLAQQQLPVSVQRYWYKNQEMESRRSWAYLYAFEVEYILSYLKSCAVAFRRCMNKEKRKLSSLHEAVIDTAEQTFNWNKIRSYTERQDRSTTMKMVETSGVALRTIFSGATN